MEPPSPHPRFPAISWAALKAECGSILAQRRREAPGLIAKGRLSPQQADRLQGLAAAWAQDAERIRRRWCDQQDAEATHSFTWADRRDGLLQELHLREQRWPERIRKGQLTAPQALQRIEALLCLLTLYEEGWDWLREWPDAQEGRQAFLAMREQADARAPFHLQKLAG
jgi:hypothetical protein